MVEGFIGGYYIIYLIFLSHKHRLRCGYGYKENGV